MAFSTVNEWLQWMQDIGKRKRKGGRGGKEIRGEVRREGRTRGREEKSRRRKKGGKGGREERSTQGRTNKFLSLESQDKALIEKSNRRVVGLKFPEGTGVQSRRQ